jgi:hypothetical protein
MRPRSLAALICSLFEGAETEILAGVREDERHTSKRSRPAPR